MSARLEKHGPILACMKMSELLKGSSSHKKQAKINKELARRKVQPE